MPSPTTFPPWMRVQDARDRYFAMNGMSADTYRASTYDVYYFGRTITFRNVPSRQRTVPFHDLHHILTGYGTDLVGEAELSAWELVGGCTSFFLYWMKTMAVLNGFLMAPRRVLRAALAARGQTTLFRTHDAARDLDRLLDMTLGDLRRLCGVPPEGQAEHVAVVHERAPHPGPMPAVWSDPHASPSG